MPFYFRNGLQDKGRNKKVTALLVPKNRRDTHFLPVTGEKMTKNNQIF
jgi:hypothetical protein